MELEELKMALATICQNIGGDWLLLGGSLVRMDLDPLRGTHDIDIVKVPLSDQVGDQLRLVQEMKKIGFSPDQVNSSVVFFLKQISNWENETRELIVFSNGRILRPTLTLFAYLKLGRATPVDLEDLQKARNKWGLQEFNEKLFKSWADAKALLKAIEIGLLK